MSRSLVSSNLVSTNVTFPRRSQSVYNNSTFHQTIQWHHSDRSSLSSNNKLAARYISRSRRTVYCNMVPPEVEVTSTIGVPDQWQGWLMGALVTVGLPFLTNKWGPLLGWMDRIKGSLQTAEDIAEAVESMAEKVEKIAEDLEAEMPEGKFKNALNVIEHAAEEIAKDADQIDHLIDKVQEMEEKVETLIEEGNEVAEKAKTHQEI